MQPISAQFYDDDDDDDEADSTAEASDSPSKDDPIANELKVSRPPMPHVLPTAHALPANADRDRQAEG